MELNYTQKIKELIDNLKARCNSAGLGGDGNEYKVITQSFLYKFLNDKFLHDVVRLKPELADASNITKALESMGENDYNLMLARLGGGSAKLKPEHLITTLFNRQNESDFYKLFNDTLHDIAVQNTGTFSVHTDEGTDVLLFDNELFNSVSDSSKRNSLARAVINLLANEKLDFSMAFDQGFDFFSTIFEYMIKDYNANGGGVYAEYYTPRSVARIMADILVGDEKPSNVKILDPSAGSGTLLMSIAHKIGAEDCSIYSQDISQKSSNLLRLNLILNNLAHSISHVVEGNTITHPAHQNIIKDEGFDYIVSNPPFKLDFSEYRDEVANSEANSERFFAGVPTVPKTSEGRKKMAIYLLFVQHILFSLSSRGKAAIVVPTGFLSAKQGIGLEIRKMLVENNIIEAAISMPPNIFANTGTNVAILFINKQKTTEDIVFVDASSMGTSVKDGKNKKTVLSTDEEQLIVKTIKDREVIDKISAVVKRPLVKGFNYDFTASLYFPIKYKKDLRNASCINAEISTSAGRLKELFEIAKPNLDTLSGIIAQITVNDSPTPTALEELDVPDGWKEYYLKDLFQFVKGRIPKKIYEQKDPTNDVYLTIESASGTAPSQFVSKEDGVRVVDEVVMVMDGAASGTVYQGRSGILGSTLSKLQLKKGVAINNAFLYYIMKSLESEIALRNTGSTVPHANKIFIDNIRIALPTNIDDIERLNDYFAMVRELSLALESMANLIDGVNDSIYSALSSNRLPLWSK